MTGLADGLASDTILLYGAARSRLVLPSGRILRLDREDVWREFVTSIRRQVPATLPPLLWNHETGRTRIGRIESAGSVSRDQLIRAGVPEHRVPHPEYLLFRVRPNARGRTMWHGDEIEHTSLGLALDREDESGTVHPFYLLELSVVNEPHVTVQPGAAELQQIELMAARSRGVVFRLRGGGPIRGERKMALSKIMQLVAELGEALAELESGAVGDAVEEIGETDDLEAATETERTAMDEELESGDENETMADSDDDDKYAMSRVKSELHELRAQLRAERETRLKAETAAKTERLKADAERHLEKLGVRVDDETRATLVRMSLSDRPGFERLAKTLPRRGDGQRLAVGANVAGREQMGASEPRERARLIAEAQRDPQNKGRSVTELMREIPLLRGGN